MNRPPNSTLARVFVALWPTDHVRARLDEVAGALLQNAQGARRVPAENLHLTLAFIGALAEDRLCDLARRVQSCTAGGFDWTIDRVGFFARAHVVWAGGTANDPLLTLAASVRRMLDAEGVAYDPKPFAPHVTLLRDVGRWPAKVAVIEPAIVWNCKAPTLIRSEPGENGVAYQPVPFDG
jgi:2'-5' RNA ligase